MCAKSQAPRFVVLCTVILMVSCIGGAQSQDDYAQRKQATDLYNDGRFVDAMPLFEKLSSDHPADIALKERWSYCILGYSATLQDPELRRKSRQRARRVAEEAKKMGDNSQLLQVLLEIPEDGSEGTFSKNKDVEDAMKDAEASFSRGDLDKAREGYLRVLALEPNSYFAALFIGDSYFKQHVYGSAGEWFARAILIDPNLETAYRYWGDALVAMDKNDEARGKYIEGIVAQPYQDASWRGMQNWLKRYNLQLNMVRLKEHSTVTSKDDKNINITIDSSLQKDDPTISPWLVYSLSRASWRGDRFKKEFPNEPKYRHTIKEECESLHMMVDSLKNNSNSRKKIEKLEPAMQALIKIDEAGFLEPYVFFNRADQELAQDYEAYRATHRDNVRRYLDESMVPKTPAVAAH